MQSQRFFIGNLPAGTTEKQISKAFQEYGEVTRIELKEKENLVDPGSVKVLAFVTLNLFDGDVDFCLRKLNAKQINGQYVRVSVAKESFMERLKREREENTKSSPKATGSGYTAQEQQVEAQSKSKKFFDIENDEPAATPTNIFENEEDSTLITKKRAANSMRNGKIVIESTNNTPIHVIGKQKDVKRLTDKSFDSDKKRKESINKKKNQYQLQKSLIQKSLSSVDTSGTKKIIFDDGDKDNEATSTKAKLFQEDSDQEDDSYANDFALKAEYEGSHGAELMRLKSKMNLDPRFKIDHKFVDKNNDDEPAKNENSERDWQYGILEQVVGSKLSNVSQPKSHDKKKLKMLRYDPSKANQDEFLVKRSEAQTAPNPVEDENAPVGEKNEVSKEVFYMISDNLSSSLKTRGDGFSLLSMFGKANDEEDKSAGQQAKEKILISKNDNTAALNPFTYDSSDSENEHDDAPRKASEEEKKGGSKTQVKLFVESFFIPKNDIRLKEGKAFFRSNQRAEKNENYDEIKDKLKTIINLKINKTKRQSKGIIKKRSIRGR